VLLDEVVQIIENLSLALGQWLHGASRGREITSVGFAGKA